MGRHGRVKNIHASSLEMAAVAMKGWGKGCSLESCKKTIGCLNYPIQHAEDNGVMDIFSMCSKKIRGKEP